MFAKKLTFNPRSKVTNIGYLLSWGAGIGWRQNYYLIPEKFILFQVNSTASAVYFLSDYSKNESGHSPFAKLYKKNIYRRKILVNK